MKNSAAAQLGLTIWTSICLVATCGCGEREESSPADRFIKHALVELDPQLYDSYAGTYELPSGAHFTVFRQQDRLMAGASPYELLPQTSRQFATNRHGGEFRFEVDSDSGRATALILKGAGDASIEARRIDPDKVEDPCEMVDAGGHRVRILRMGSGSPTVIVENGAGSSIEESSVLQSRLAQYTQVVTYDHAGTGGSESGPLPRHALQIARELRQAMIDAGIPSPWIFLGHSIGGHYIRVFASEFPDDVAGVILLDPSPDWEDMRNWYLKNKPDQVDKFDEGWRLFQEAMPVMAQFAEPGRRAEWESLPATLEQAHQARSLPQVPVVQITGTDGRNTKTDVRDKILIYDQWLKKHIPHARHVFAEESGHSIFASQPDLVVQEVRKVLEESRLPIR